MHTCAYFHYHLLLCLSIHISVPSTPTPSRKARNNTHRNTIQHPLLSAQHTLHPDPIPVTNDRRSHIPSPSSPPTRTRRLRRTRRQCRRPRNSQPSSPSTIRRSIHTRRPHRRIISSTTRCIGHCPGMDTLDSTA